MGAFSNKVAIITGALTGIGRSTALALAQQGASLLISGRNEQVGLALAGELRHSGGPVAFFRADVRIEADVMGLVDEAVTRFGRVDVAINNAGTEGTPGALSEMAIEAYQAMFETNVLGTLLCLKHELRAMQKQGSGSIVNISSTMGKRGAPNMTLYVASKHAVEGATKSAALEAAMFNVRVNAVAPGPTETSMLDRLAGTPERKAALFAPVPLKRGARPEEIAEAILFVASDAASYITGQIIRVNGGKTAA